MKSVATTLVREAKFDTTDFATAKARGCEGFRLLVSRTRVDSHNGWFGAFQRGDKRLDVIGHVRTVRRYGQHRRRPPGSCLAELLTHC